MRSGQPKSNRGGTAVGLKRANQLAARTPLSEDTVKRMFSFFSRHEVDKQSKSWKEGNSKGEQVWLMWGGDPGFSWSKRIVKSLEKEKMAGQNHLMVCMRQQVNASSIKRETRDDGEYIIIKSATLPDNVVMNGGMYPADEIERSYNTLERTLAPIGHPSNADGEFLSANDPYAISNFHVGAHNENVRRKDGRVFLDKVIKVENAKTTEKGQRLLDAITKIESGKQANIHTSTGVFLEREEVEGNNAAGDSYDWIARNMYFDHDAILLDEEGAATPDQGVGINVNQKRVMVVNSELPSDYEPQYNQDSAEDGINTNEPQGDLMYEEMILKVLADANIDVAGMSEEEVFKAFKSYLKNGEGMDDEAVVNAVVSKVQAMVEPLANKVQALEANANAAVEAEKAALIAKVEAAGIDKSVAETMDVNQLSAIVANQSAPTGHAYMAGPGAFNSAQEPEMEMVD